MWTGVLLLSLVAAAPYAGQPAPTAAADCTRWQDCRDRVEAALHAKALGLPYLYLGYWIKGSPKMGYKQRFQPQERLTSGGWQRA